MDTITLGTPKKKDDDGILTMAFVNMQPLKTVYDVSRAFTQGTLFPNIDKPFWAGEKR